jgi:tetratricopeptide (TPR) repeat protein
MLSPRDPRRPFFQTLSAGSYVAGGRYEEAVEMAEASLRHNPFHLSAHRCRVIGLQLAGREGEARNAAKELMRIDPSLRVSEYQRTHPAAQTEIIQTWAGALKQAGVPVN